TAEIACQEARREAFAAPERPLARRRLRSNGKTLIRHGSIGLWRVVNKPTAGMVGGFLDPRAFMAPRFRPDMKACRQSCRLFRKAACEHSRSLGNAAHAC